MYGAHRDPHVRTPSFPTRRSSDLPFGRRGGSRAMRSIGMVLAAIATPALVSAQEKETDLTLMPSAPVAEQRLHETMLHGTTLSDPWHWLRDTSYPVVDDPEIGRAHV